ncbi:MAG: ATP-binding cassette domain-containing protein [Dethiobacter sp.]|jgi:iron(III) transport system ATP-binding protein|nr:ATP-binding cassette domain-containing protein [Dethiobacter sp.]MBS3948471.1 ATP-binding cassette domain-containing protein [Dethiobacter sp.]
MCYLKAENICKQYAGKAVLTGVTAEIAQGELVCILGPSGCGKTTLLRIMAGLETADRGKVIIDGKDCTMLPPAKRNFGIVFQSYALFPNMTVEQNVLFGLAQQKQLNKGQQKAKVFQVLALVDLLEHKNKYPAQLSGGQQQRTALARAIALSPRYLLLDEPLSALDAKVRARLRLEIRKIQRELGITTIMVTHDQEEALTMADRIIVMNNAVIEQVGAPRTIYENPASAFVANFIGTMNFYKNYTSTFGVRPENIELTKNNLSGNFWTGKVSALEFKGAMIRVYSKLHDNHEICVDLPVEKATTLALKENDTVYLRVADRHLIQYAEVPKAV